MNDETKETTLNETGNEVVQAHKRRTALVLYLAVLFGVALLLVVFSMISQNQKLMDSSNNAIGRAEALQTENRALRDQKDALDEQIDALEAEKEKYLSQQEADAEAIQALKDENEQLVKDKAAQEAEAAKRSAELDDAKQAFDLLLQAQNAYQTGDMETLVSTMQTLEPLRALLGEQAAELYETLRSQLPE